jgi:hypothetical protein
MSPGLSRRTDQNRARDDIVPMLTQLLTDGSDRSVIRTSADGKRSVHGDRFRVTNQEEGQSMSDNQISSIYLFLLGPC